jgi:hypothetical protein
MDSNTQPKKSHKKKKPTINEIQADLKRAATKNAPPKEKDKVAKYGPNKKRASEAGNLEGHNKKLQKHSGVIMDQKTTLPFVRGDDLMTPTKSAKDAGKLVRNNFSSQGTFKTKAKEAANSKRKKDDENPKEQTSQRNDVARSKDASNGAESPTKPQLGINMRKLILEDFIMLEPDTDVRILVSPDHSSYEDIFMKLPHESKILLNSRDPSTKMYCYDVVVTTNAQLDALSSGTLNREEFLHLFTYEGGGALIFHFRDANNRTSIALKWAEFVEHCKTLQLWAEIPNNRDYRAMLLPKRKKREELTQLYKQDAAYSNLRWRHCSVFNTNNFKTLSRFCIWCFRYSLADIQASDPLTSSLLGSLWMRLTRLT